ncbi:MAG: lycopene beta-cyclase CrtY, partial [Deltaproteobacteria bacterium]|nr:lycopene beta-cyclase CrtY [Deltaproteobacteria bacterium]
PYACVTSARLATVVTESLERAGSELHLQTAAVEVGADRVVIRAASGATEELRARVVIDARGPDTALPTACGWQKFLGQEVVLRAPHGLDRPMLMDAKVPQLDGFRFVYVLPLGVDRLLVEDTYFSDKAYLDVGVLRERIASYVAARGWSVARVEREEVGVLPLPWSGDAPIPSSTTALSAGYGGGWFHPVTGYSFPIASRLAELIATTDPDRLFGASLDAHQRAHARQVRFAHRLNRMLFHWFAPADRYRVLERFYRLSEDTIRRFYALELTGLDRARILFGRPPRGLSVRGMLGMEVA